MPTARIVIADYDPAWPGMFAAARDELMRAVGPWVTGIEHIGSTAVPGLAAKPVIDVLVAVRALAEADAHCIEPIVTLSYEYIAKYEAEMPYRRYFRRAPDDGQLEHHIHLVERDSEFWERHLLFRDYLRAHPAVAREYGRLKRELAPLFVDTNDYADAKTEFIRDAETAARAWRVSGDT